MKKIAITVIGFLIIGDAFANNIVSNNHLLGANSTILKFNNTLRPSYVPVTFVEGIHVGYVSLLQGTNIDTTGLLDEEYKNLTYFNDFVFSDNGITANISTGGGNAVGGVMFIDKQSDIFISNSVFSTNYVETDAGSSIGGAIANFIDTNNMLNISNTNFVSNSAKHNDPSNADPTRYNGSEASGGAILNATNIKISNSSFKDNSVDAKGYFAFGGAIANRNGNMIIEDTSFENNSANSESGEAHGGAIANYQMNTTINPTTTIIANNNDVVFSGNTTTDANGTVSNAIYNDNGTINLNANSEKSIIFNDGIDGGTSGTNIININNSSDLPAEYASSLDNKGTVIFNNTVQDNNVNLYGGTIQLGNDGSDAANFVIADTYFKDSPITVYGDAVISVQNGKIDNSLNLGSLSFDNSSGKDPILSLFVDVDLNNKTSDKINVDSLTLSSTSPQIVLNNINILDYGNDEISVVNLAMDGNLANAVEYDLPTNIYTPVYSYDVSFDDSTKNATFSRYVNESISNQSVSMKSLSNIQHDIARRILQSDLNFKFDVSVEKLVLSDRIKYRSKVISFKNPNDSKVIVSRIYNLVRVDNESDALRLASGEDVYGTLASLYYYNNGSSTALNKSGVWFDIIGNTQHNKYNHLSTVKNDYFSILLGLNTKTKRFSNGVRAYGSLYVGYLRDNQKYTGSKIQSDGGYIGVSGLAEYNNFIFGLMANAGLANNDASNIYGKDSYDNYWLTLGAKFGYNWNIGKGYFLEPSVYLSYVFMNADDYYTKNGVKIKEDNLNSLQISPTLKFAKVFKNNSVLSAKVRYVAEVANNLNLRADNIMIYELGNGNFVEYGISYDAIIMDSFSINLEVNRRDGDTQGWNGGIGMKFLF